MNRRRFLLAAAIALPRPGWAMPPYGRVRQLSGDVTLNDYPLRRNTALQPGQTLATGGDGEVWFTVGEDAFFLRPNSRLRLEATGAASVILDWLRLVGGGLGATFSRGPSRRLITPTSTIGIRGTGVYLEAAPAWTYACTCFGTTEISGSDPAGRSAEIHSRRHVARRIDADGRIVAVPFVRHTSEEIARLESLVGRPNPF